MTTSKSILFDTNVMVYNQDIESEFYTASANFHEMVLSGKITACISTQNCSEFISVVTNDRRVTRPHSMKKAVEELEKYIDSGLFNIICPNMRTSEIFIKLLRKYESKNNKHVFDIFLVAIMLSNNVKKILTANHTDFEMFDEIDTIRLV